MLLFASLVALQQLLLFPLATPFRAAALPADQAGIPRPTPGNWSVLSRPVGCTGNLGAQWETRNLALYTLIWFLPVDYPTLYCKRRLVWWIMERIYPSKPWERGRGVARPRPGHFRSGPHGSICKRASRPRPGPERGKGASDPSGATTSGRHQTQKLERFF